MNAVVAARRLVIVFVAGVVALGGAVSFTYTAERAATSASGIAQAARDRFDAAVLAAAAAGYNSDDLAPVLDQVPAIDDRPVPLLPGDRAAYYRAVAADFAALDEQLTALEAHQLDLLQRATVARLDDLREQIARDQAQGVDPVDLAPIRAQADAVAATLATADGPNDYRAAFSALGVPFEQAGQVRVQHEAEMQAVQAEADRLQTTYGGNLSAVRAIGTAALSGGRDDESYELMMRLPPLGRAYDLLESNASKLGATDAPTLALAVALEERYRDEVHQALTSHLPRKVILVSIAAEELWAYDHGQLYIDTLVTTGVPELPTDIGLMRIFRKESPVHFVSPFPKGSRWDYGSIDAKYAMFFQPSGEAIHDSWWRHWYGPGSNLNGHGSHGCIGLPYGPIDKIYPWGDIGVPVVVIPGGGELPADQLAAKTYDDPFWGTGPAWF
jgi:lipoprotein-anchoring transpeptidase ErfK/SrfK